MSHALEMSEKMLNGTSFYPFLLLLCLLDHVTHIQSSVLFKHYCIFYFSLIMNKLMKFPVIMRYLLFFKVD